MKLWNISALASVGLVILASAVHAQLPSAGGTNMQFVPVDTTRNLAAPVPTMKPPPQQQQKPFLARVGDRLSALNPFRPKQPPARVPGPVAPTTQLPRDQQPPANASAPPSLPQIPPLVQGSGR
jgi:hypothetical protein